MGHFAGNSFEGLRFAVVATVSGNTIFAMAGDLSESEKYCELWNTPFLIID